MLKLKSKVECLVGWPKGLCYAAYKTSAQQPVMQDTLEQAGALDQCCRRKWLQSDTCQVRDAARLAAQDVAEAANLALIAALGCLRVGSNIAPGIQS